MKEDYKKMKISLTYWLLGKGYYNAYNAMIFAEKLHNGLRKDGEHEFSHQISQALLARTLIGDVMYKEELFMVIFLHDVCEDKGISYEEIEKLFGVLVMNSVKLMTKVYQGVKTPNNEYYAKMIDCPITSLAKGFDRVHNLMSMLGGFTVEKRISYVNETLEYTVPMLKLGRRNFPMQESVYENIKFIMTNQIKLYNALNNAETVIISLKLGINISEETYLEMCNLITHYKNVQLGIHEANDDDGVEPPYIRTATVDVHYTYNPKFGDYKECECGHDYHRHFDGYDNNEAVGCKYCGCYDFNVKTV